MKVQDYLRSGKTLDQLKEELGIVSVPHPDDGRVILNYHQCESPKMDPIVKECRGLVLDRHDNWEVVARAFPRFFRYGEALEETSRFDWSIAQAQEKVDGSLILLYWYQGAWHLNTRGSFGAGKLPYQDITWREACFRLFRNDRLGQFNSNTTFVFELCSMGNKVVREYAKSKLYLLSAFNTDNGLEVPSESCNFVAEVLEVPRPKTYPVGTLDELVAWLSSNEVEEDFEGVVLRDVNLMRLKLKNPRYDALHHLWDNGSLAHPSHLLPFILRGQSDYVIKKFPSVAPICEKMGKKLDELKQGMMVAWEGAKDKEVQKDFALAIVKATPLNSILFEARKRKKDPLELWPEFNDLLLKHVGV